MENQEVWNKPVQSAVLTGSEYPPLRPEPKEYVQTKNSGIHLQCPECRETTRFKHLYELKCSSCDTSFDKRTFLSRKKFKKAALSVLMVAATGAGAWEYVESPRLSAESEYALMSACIYGHNSTTPVNVTRSSAKKCGCMMEKALDEVGTGRDRNEPDEVIPAYGSAMRSAYSSCKG